MQRSRRHLSQWMSRSVKGAFTVPSHIGTPWNASSSCSPFSHSSATMSGGTHRSARGYFFTGVGGASGFRPTSPLFQYSHREDGFRGGEKREEASQKYMEYSKPSQWTKKKVAFLTDVEGNMGYFQKWVEQSDIICWEEKPTAPPRLTHQGGTSWGPVSEPPQAKEKPLLNTSDSSSSCRPIPLPLTYFDLDHLVLGFRDDDGTSEFVYGGDAFDQGWDLSFSRALLDFKDRFPDRVHLILGNRDLNKIVMKRIFPPTAHSEGAEVVEPSTTTAGDVVSKDTDLSFLYSMANPYASTQERASFVPPSPSFSTVIRQQRGVMGYRSPKEAEEAIFPSKSGAPARVSYEDFLRNEKKEAKARGRAMKQEMENNHKAGEKEKGAQVEEERSLEADPVSFLKWALIHRLGSSMTFENRRQELHALHIQEQQRQQQHNKEERVKGDKHTQEKRTTTELHRPLPPPLPTDEEVAASFAAAAAPGGVYDRYLQHGRLLHVIGSALFVHGGLAEENLGLVPSVQAPYNSPLEGCQSMLEVGPSSAAASLLTSTPSEVPMTFLNWFAALHTFHQIAFQEFHTWTKSKGEALRRYGNSRVFTLYSVTVNSPLHMPHGASFFPLPVMHHLLMNGLQYMCVGHMPCGDTPLILRQPPLGSFTCVAADNSYSGRGNPYSSRANPRGKAVTEVILHLLAPRPLPTIAETEEIGTQEETRTRSQVEDGSCGRVASRVRSTGSEVGTEEAAEANEMVLPEEEEEYIHLHGTRADGTPFSFDIRPSEPYLGRCLRRRVRCPPSQAAPINPPNRNENRNEGVEEEYWWVKRRGIYPSTLQKSPATDEKASRMLGTSKAVPEGGEEEYYALHCTKDQFYSEKELLVPTSVLAQIFSSSSPATATSSWKEGGEESEWADFFLPEGSASSVFSSVVGGQLRNEYAPESLREVRVSRLKTKVVPSSSPASGSKSG